MKSHLIFLYPLLGITPTSIYRNRAPLLQLKARSYASFATAASTGRSYLIVSGIFVFGITAYTSFFLIASQASKSAEDLPVQDADVSPTYDLTAKEFDSNVGWSEFLYGIKRQRRLLAQKARGHVLEVSVGTGRNSKYYNLDYSWSDWYANTRYAELKRRKAAEAALKKAAPETAISLETEALDSAVPDSDEGLTEASPWVEARSKLTTLTPSETKRRNEVSSLTFVDLSAPMVEVARKKFESSYPGYGPVQFLTQSALDPLTANRITNSAQREGGYDYVVQSMGLCSTPDPVELLKHLGKLAHPERGRILLLEHGRGTWGWLNDYLDSTASVHAKHHGCWYNRDIGKIVEESGLVVEKLKRKHFGTLWIIEARPASREEMQEKEHIQKAVPSVAVAKVLDNVEDIDVKEPVEVEGSDEGPTRGVWNRIKKISGMDQLKEEDPGQANNQDHKEG